jgi:hypothetical protein
LNQNNNLRIYCDLDGVLVDFESGIRSLFPEQSLAAPKSFHINDLNRRDMWRRVRTADPPFFETLHWTAGGKRLWQAIRHLQPDILTGVPPFVSSRQQKMNWCRQQLCVPVRHVDMAGPWRSHVNVNGGETSLLESSPNEQAAVCNVITCWSDNKHYHSGPNAVLIDDRECLQRKWEAAGGIFIHHNGDVDATLGRLRDIGVL